jgi:hypothetical protein
VVHRIQILLLTSWALAGGCASDEVTLTPDQTPPVAAEDFAAQLNAAVCQLWVRCGMYQDPTACEATNPVRVSWNAQRVYDVSQGTEHYEGSRAADCIARIASASCRDNQLTPGNARLGLLLAECDLFVLGNVPEGGTCNHTEECGANSACNPDPNGPSSGACIAGTCGRFDSRTCGTGTPPCPDNEVCLPGGVCGGSGRADDRCSLDDDCSKGLLCTDVVDAYGPTGTRKCAPAPNTGEVCSDSDQCPLGNGCIPTSDPGVVGRCLPNVGLGEACGAYGMPACKQDLVCDLSTHTCMVAQPGTVGGDGSVCR